MSDTDSNSENQSDKLIGFKNKLNQKVGELNDIYSEAQSLGLRMSLEQKDNSTCRFLEFKDHYSVKI